MENNHNIINLHIAKACSVRIKTQVPIHIMLNLIKQLQFPLAKPEGSSTDFNCGII